MRGLQELINAVVPSSNAVLLGSFLRDDTWCHNGLAYYQENILTVDFTFFMWNLNKSRLLKNLSRRDISHKSWNTNIVDHDFPVVLITNYGNGISHSSSSLTNETSYPLIRYLDLRKSSVHICFFFAGRKLFALRSNVILRDINKLQSPLLFRALCISTAKKLRDTFPFATVRKCVRREPPSIRIGHMMKKKIPKFTCSWFFYQLPFGNQSHARETRRNV